MSLKDCSTYAGLKIAVEVANQAVKDANDELESLEFEDPLKSVITGSKFYVIKKIEQALVIQKEAIKKMEEHVRNCSTCQKQN